MASRIACMSPAAILHGGANMPQASIALATEQPAGCKQTLQAELDVMIQSYYRRVATAAAEHSYRCRMLSAPSGRARAQCPQLPLTFK